MEIDNSFVKMACRDAFECGIDDINGNSYEHQLTDSFFTLILTLSVDCKMDLPYLCHDDDVKSDIAYMAWRNAEEMGGICSTYDVVEAIGNYKFKEDHPFFLKGQKMVDKRTKGYKKLYELAHCLDMFRNMGVLLAVGEHEAIERNYAGVKEALGLS